MEEIKPKEYKIFFGIDRDEINIHNKDENKNEHIKNLKNFKYYDYTFNANIMNLKEFFITNFGAKYPCCECQLAVYFKTNDKYQIISSFNYTKLLHDELYLIKIKDQCNCEYKNYNKYMSNSKYDIISKLKAKVEKNESNNSKLREELKEIEKINKKLQEENEKLKKTEEIKQFIKDDVENFYDIIIDINSIKNVNIEGWNVKFNEQGLNKYKKFKGKDLITLGVLGNTNKGKSFLLSRISKIKLLSGTSIETKGISVKYPDLKGYGGRQIILLDTAGLETPVLGKKNNEDENEDNKKEIKQNEVFKKKARDKTVTELFLQNLIINISDILLIVVGKLTYSEQLLINKIKIEAKKQNKGRLIIIHNLQEFRTKEQVEDYINNTLMKCSNFNLKERTWISTEKTKEEIIKDDKKDEEANNEQKKINNMEGENNEQNNSLEKNEKKEEELIQEKKEENNIEENKNDEIMDNNIENDNENNINKNKNDEIPLIKNQNGGEIHINPIENEEQFINNNNGIVNYNNQNNQKENNQIQNNNVINKNDKNDGECKKKLNKVHYTEVIKYEGDKKLEIFHLILANEDSEAGDFYNEYGYKFIENIYNLISEPKKFDVFEQVKNNFKKLSKAFLIDNIEKNNFNEDITNDKEMKLDFDENKELSLKKCFRDELGFSLFKTDKFEPKFNYFKSDKNTLEIRLEIPGNCSCFVSHKVEKDETIITVKGSKKNDKIPEKPEDDLFNTREFSEFELNIPLKVEEFKIIEDKPKEGYPKFINGICLIQYKIASEGKEEIITIEDL